MFRVVGLFTKPSVNGTTRCHGWSWPTLNAFILVFLICSSSCEEECSVTAPGPTSGQDTLVRAVDISTYPKIALSNASYLNASGEVEPLLNILKEEGINTIRLRLWVNPTDGHSGFQEVVTFSNELKAQGFKIWLSLHYSDTWADPGQQSPPQHWQNLSFETLADSIYHYTEKVVTEIHPDYIQLGNEINSGFLHPYGHITDNPEGFLQFLEQGSAAVRAASSDCQIIIHYAGITGAEWFYDVVDSVDYDVIGLSYYPIWHGKNLDSLVVTLQQLATVHDKDVVIAETAYPFTLDWNDYTNNIVGLQEHLILPEYPASPTGQSDFVRDIADRVLSIDGGIGYCYWGGELIAWKGPQANDASPWENQALFDFNYQALPALDVLGDRP
ncbi:MAG: glycoside hydrolase family 53 protein [Chitinophagales bacterium]